MQKKTLSSTVALFSASCLFLGTMAYASDQALLDALVTNGYLTREQAETIAKTPEPQVPEVLPKGKAVEQLKITGRLQLQYNYFNLSGGLNDGRSDPQGFYFRRVYLGAEAKLAEDWSGTLIVDLGGTNGNILLDTGLITWSGISGMTVSAGWDKVPFGYEETTSSAKLKTIERSLLARAFDFPLRVSSQHTGIFVNGKIGDSGLKYSLFFGNNDNSSYRSDKHFSNVGAEYDGYSGFGRIQYVSEDSNVGKIVVGLDMGYVQSGVYNMGVVADTNSHVWAYGGHVNYTLDRFAVLGEFLGATLNNARGGSDDASIYGFTLMPSFKLSDQFELVVQYAYMDTDGAYSIIPGEAIRRSNASVSGCDKGQQFYAGVNWYIVSDDVKLQAGYEAGRFKNPVDGSNGKSNVDGVRVQMQMLW